MSLIILIGAQAVGKMTVGKELEKQIDGKLLYNHQTIDLYANFLGYTQETFRLSDLTRRELFKSFVLNKNNNVTEAIIFTIMIGFSEAYDRQFLKEIAAIFFRCWRRGLFCRTGDRFRNTHSAKCRR
jgi:tRNA uridine 5-carbamoylmethylation protein Kti12